MLEMGPVEQTLARQAYQAGEDMPERIAGAPELGLGLQLYLNAFFDLDSERSHSVGATAISWSSIMNYAKAFEFSYEQSDFLLYFVRRMDESHLVRIRAKIKAANNGGK